MDGQGGREEQMRAPETVTRSTPETVGVGREREEGQPTGREGRCDESATDRTTQSTVLGTARTIMGDSEG